MFSLASHSIIIDTRNAREQEYWQAYGEIIDRVGLGLMKGSASGWKPVNAQELSDRWSLYYPDYQFSNQLTDVSIDKKFTIHFPKSVNMQTVTPASIELIARDSGERVPLDITQLSNTDLQAAPQNNLSPGTSYWLLLHPGIQYSDNSSLATGVVCAATVNP
jgi:carboxyl-terminal processing protease